MDDFLTHFDFSDECSSGDLSSLFSEKKIEAGGILFDYNDPADTLYFLKDGHLAIYKKTGFLDKMQVVALLDPGTIVGEGAILQQHVRNTRVTAIRDSKLFGLTKENFEKFKKKFPVTTHQIVEYLFTIASLRLEKTSERLARIL